MTEADLLKLADVMAKMPAPEGRAEWTVFAMLVGLLILAVVFLFRWLVKVTERAEERGSTLIRETTAALTANTASNEKVAAALASLAGEVRADHSRTQELAVMAGRR